MASKNENQTFSLTQVSVAVDAQEIKETVVSQHPEFYYG